MKSHEFFVNRGIFAVKVGLASFSASSGNSLAPTACYKSMPVLSGIAGPLPFDNRSLHYQQVLAEQEIRFYKALSDVLVFTSQLRNLLVFGFQLIQQRQHGFWI
jgi:hypothetical protein